MSWTCPTCSRSFIHENQSHSCNLVNLESHFQNKSPDIIALFDALINRVNEFGAFKIEPVKDAIILRRSSAFITIRIQKTCLDLSFKLDKHVEEFPVYKSLQLSAHRWAHTVKIETVDELDSQLVGWLKRAYELVEE